MKKYETIAACGIDCGLCQRFYTKGNSDCLGCGGLNFKEKHPSCGVLTCYVIKNGFETCAECKDFPCATDAKCQSLHCILLIKPIRSIDTGVTITSNTPSNPA